MNESTQQQEFLLAQLEAMVSAQIPADEQRLFQGFIRRYFEMSSMDSLRAREPEEPQPSKSTRPQVVDHARPLGAEQDFSLSQLVREPLAELADNVRLANEVVLVQLQGLAQANA